MDVSGGGLVGHVQTMSSGARGIAVGAVERVGPNNIRVWAFGHTWVCGAGSVWDIILRSS